MCCNAIHIELRSEYLDKVHCDISYCNTVAPGGIKFTLLLFTNKHSIATFIASKHTAVPISNKFSNNIKLTIVVNLWSTSTVNLTKNTSGDCCTYYIDKGFLFKLLLVKLRSKRFCWKCLAKDLRHRKIFHHWHKTSQIVLVPDLFYATYIYYSCLIIIKNWYNFLCFYT